MQTLIYANLKKVCKYCVLYLRIRLFRVSFRNNQAVFISAHLKCGFVEGEAGRGAEIRVRGVQGVVTYLGSVIQRNLPP